MRVITITQLAEEAGVAISSASSWLHRHPAAKVGDRVDMDHPEAKKYMRDRRKKQEAERIRKEADPDHPRYADAVKLCHERGRCTVRLLEKELPGVGRATAKIIVDQIKRNGLKFGGKKAPRGLGRITSPANYKRGPTARVSADMPVKATPPEQPPGPTQAPDPQIPPEIEAYADMTLRDLIGRYGTVAVFNDWLNALSKIESITEKRVKNEATAGKLISRDLVRQTIIVPIDTAFGQILTDGAKAIAVEVGAMAKGDASDQEIERAVEKVVASFIRPAKAKIKRGIENA